MASVAHPPPDPERRPDSQRLRGSGHSGFARAGHPEMKDALRLLGYARRYLALLALSVLLMAMVGLMTAARPILLKPVLGRVIRPSSDALPEPIFTVLRHPIYLEQFFPAQIHNIFTIVAISILIVFLVRGICDYLGDYLTSYVGFSAVTDL